MSRLILGLAILVGSSAFAEEAKFSPRNVSVTGTAIARVQPDIVAWHLTIRRYDKELAKAQAACDETVKRVLALRTDLKLKSEDAQTGYLSVQKVFDRDQAGNQTSFRHFVVERSITLKQRDVMNFDQVLNRLMAVADVEVGYSLESSQYLEMRAQTRLEAVKVARQKAAAMTELLGAKLGRVLRIAEPVENWNNPGHFNNMAFAGVRQAEIDNAEGTFAPGSVDVRVSIEVAFEIE